MTKPNSTEIIVLLDRSGSMQAVKADMEGGFNTFIEEQKKQPGDCTVTLMQFDDQYETVYSALPVSKVPPLDLQPRGMTALLDALGQTIANVGSRLSTLNESKRPSQVIVLVITDGAENSSKEYNRKRVFDMIKHQRDKYAWEFVFLGANQDAIATATSIGISMNNAVTFAATATGSNAAYAVLSRGVSNYRSAGVKSMENIVNQSMYDAELKEQATKVGNVANNVIVPPKTTT